MSANLSNKLEQPTTPSLHEALKVWTRIGFLSFGGPAAQIALMHREIVDARQWLSEKQFLNALSFCMLLPGPEAMQLATYAGWRLHGTLGGLIAGLLFVIPGAIVIAILATIYVLYGDVSSVNALFLGVKAAVIVVVIEALMRVAKRALSLPEHWIIALLSFVGIYFFTVPYPIIIALAAAFGFMRSTTSVDEHTPSAAPQARFGTLSTIAIWLFIWWAPILMIGAYNPESLLFDIGLFFSKLAVVTFGGAYAVLAYLGQDVVSQYGWISAGEMIDGLGLAETTPGPLILVTEYVGFIAAYREGGFGYAIAGASMTLWATFIPCFLWIFASAPYIDWISAQSRLRGALSGITAAVVGVILNLSVWFSLHVFFSEVDAQQYGPITLWNPSLETLDLRVLALTGLCALLLFKFHWGIIRVLAVSAFIGLLMSWF